MKRKPYVKPTIEVENFIITDYVASCTNLVNRNDQEWKELEEAAAIAGLSVEEALEFQIIDCKNTPTAFVGYDLFSS